MTRRKYLVETLHKSGVCISYAYALLLYDYWALKYVDVSGTCSLDIADNKPIIAIVDNDDFKVDTLTGNAAGAHRNYKVCTASELRNESLEDPVPGDTKKKEVASKLRQKCAELTQVRQHRCPLVEPPLRHRTGPIVNGIDPQRARSVKHALSRADNGSLKPARHEADGSSIQWSPVLSSSTYQ